ncbi:MAG: CRISPR-associated protein Cas4 [Caldimicrobium sp.]|nr:CRISPR-associated protein Cas4 [Caldimicrobium sp.]
MQIDEFDFNSLKVNGIKINYLYVCERKLWLFDKGLQMESTHDKVLIGKLVSEYSYPTEDKREVLIDNLINIDLVGDEEIRELKLSNRLAEADRMQILYYLYFLKQLGIEKRGVINYLRMRKREIIVLTPEAEKEVEVALVRVNEVLKISKPPKVHRKSYCSKCAYYEFCFG